MSLCDPRREATRAAIHEPARELLEAGGADALTFRAIAERADVSVDIVANHASSEAHLARRDAWFRSHFGHGAARPPLARSPIRAGGLRVGRRRRPYRKLNRGFVAELATALEVRGRLRPPVAARAQFDTYIGVVLQLLRQEVPAVEARLSALRGSLEGVLPVLFEP